MDVFISAWSYLWHAANREPVAECLPWSLGHLSYTIRISLGLYKRKKKQSKLTVESCRHWAGVRGTWKNTNIRNISRLRQWTAHWWLASWIIQGGKVKVGPHTSNWLLWTLLMWQVTANWSTSVPSPSPKTTVSWLRNMRNASNRSMYSTACRYSIWLGRTTMIRWKRNTRHRISSRMQPRLMGTIWRARWHIRTCIKIRHCQYSNIALVKSINAMEQRYA